MLTENQWWVNNKTMNTQKIKGFFRDALDAWTTPLSELYMCEEAYQRELTRMNPDERMRFERERIRIQIEENARFRREHPTLCSVLATVSYSPFEIMITDLVETVKGAYGRVKKKGEQ